MYSFMISGGENDQFIRRATSSKSGSQISVFRWLLSFVFLKQTFLMLIYKNPGVRNTFECNHLCECLSTLLTVWIESADPPYKEYFYRSN